MRNIGPLIASEGLHEGCTGLVLAVSGGPDSMAMLTWYAAQSLPFPLSVAHVNHGLRPEAEEEEALVSDYCNRLALPCKVFRTHVKENMKKGETVESAARRLRYGFLREYARERGASHLATAHTKDDQCETVLLHLIHGAGPKGLGGILPKRKEENLTLIRPLLATEKSALLTYCGENSVPYALDESNGDLSFTRNRIRHRILPELEQINPNIRTALCRTAGTMQDLQRATEEEAKLFLQNHPEGLPTKEVKALPRPVQAEVLRQVFSGLGKVLSSQQTQEALALLEKPTGQVEFDRKYRLHSGGGILTVEYSLPPLPECFVEQEQTVLPDGRILTLQKILANDTNRNTLIPPVLPLTLRPRREGDKIKTPGGTKTLKKRMGELKIPHARRDRLWVLARGTDVLWCEEVGCHLDFSPKTGEYGYFIVLSEQ